MCCVVHRYQQVFSLLFQCIWNTDDDIYEEICYCNTAKCNYYPIPTTTTTAGIDYLDTNNNIPHPRDYEDHMDHTTNGGMDVFNYYGSPGDDGKSNNDYERPEIPDNYDGPNFGHDDDNNGTNDDNDDSTNGDSTGEVGASVYLPGGQGRNRQSVFLSYICNILILFSQKVK